MKITARSRLAPFAISAALAALPLGCASPSDLTVTSLKNNQTFQQGFTQAYTRQDENGDTDVVLVDEAAALALAGQDSGTPVREVMHMRIVWAPTRDMKAVSCNAAVKWYVIGHRRQDVLEYAGSAFVSMTPGDEQITLKVQNAVLKPLANHGSLTDPVGPARLQGTFVAKTNDKRVEQILSDLKTATSAADAPLPAYTAIETTK